MTSSQDNNKALIIKKPKNIVGKSRNIDEDSDRDLVLENKMESNEIKNFVFKKTKRMNKSFNAKSELETISPKNNVDMMYPEAS